MPGMFNPPPFAPAAFISVLMLTGFFAGCVTHIEPMAPTRTVDVWVPDEAQTQPAGAPSSSTQAAEAEATTESAATATAPATQPGHRVTQVVDPNQTLRFIFNASYDNVWQQGLLLLHNMGFAMDRQDYRLGEMTTQPLQSAQIIEFWRPEHTLPVNALENTVNSQRRTVRLRISNVPGKPEFYEIAIQVLVERRTNPTEAISGPVFVEGSGFGRNAISLHSDYAVPKPPPSAWVMMGHDADLEKKLLDLLFQRI
jgi:hypothetical protein